MEWEDSSKDNRVIEETSNGDKGNNNHQEEDEVWEAGYRGGTDKEGREGDTHATIAERKAIYQHSAPNQNGARIADPQITYHGLAMEVGPKERQLHNRAKLRSLRRSKRKSNSHNTSLSRWVGERETKYYSISQALQEQNSRDKESEMTRAQY